MPVTTTGRFSSFRSLARMASSRGWPKGSLRPLGERSVLHGVRCGGLLNLDRETTVGRYAEHFGRRVLEPRYRESNRVIEAFRFN